MPSYKAPKNDEVIADANEAAAQLRRVKEDVQNKGAEYHLSLEHQIDLFTSAHTLGLDETKRYVNFDAKSPKPADIIFRVMGMLQTAPKCAFVSPTTRKEDKKNSEVIEKHVNAVYPALHRRYKTNFNLHSLFWQLLAGHGYLQQTFLPSYWDKEEFKKRDGEDDEGYNARAKAYRSTSGPPFMVEALDPRTVWPIRTPMGTRAWVKVYNVQRIDAERAFRERGKSLSFRRDKGGQWGAYTAKALDESAAKLMPENDRDGESDDTVEYMEYIDKNYCYYVVGSEVVHSYKHKGGIQIFEAKALETGFPEESLSSVGILWAVRNAIPQYDFFRTLWAQRAYLDVFPQLASQLGPGEHPILDTNTGENQVWKIEPQTIIQVRGVLTNVLANSGSGEDFRAAVDMLGGDIDAATISALARGIAGAQQPGYSINQLSQAMRSLWRNVIESREEQHAEMYAHYLWCVKHLVKREVVAWALTGEYDERGRASGDYVSLEPEDIPDHFEIHANLEPELPIDKQGNMQVWMKAGESGWATEEEVARYGFDAVNPQERALQIKLEQAVRAMLPDIIKDAVTLGRVKLTAEVAKSQGSDRLNTMFSQSAENAEAAAKIGTTPPPGGGQEGGGAGPQVPGVNGATPGIPEVTGANPVQPAPGPRAGVPVVAGP
jgi:hypothetical protein